MSNIIIPVSPVATFTSPNSRASIKKITIPFTPTQQGEGDPSPDNIRLFNQLTGVNIYHSGEDTENPQTLTVSWSTDDQVIVGGELTINDDGSGTLVQKYRFLDGGAQTWTKVTNNSYRNFRFVWSAAQQDKNVVTIWSDHYKGAASSSGVTADGDNYVWMRAATGSDSQHCCVKDTSKASLTAAEFKTAMTGVKFVALWKESSWITYNLTNIELFSLLSGVNNVWNDIGDTGIEYVIEDKATIKLNGVDMTNYFTPRGIKVSYVKVDGGNGGVYLSGEREEDILAWKAVVTLTCMPLTEEQQYDVLQKVTAADPTLYYFDPLTKTYKTIHYMASVEETVHRGKGGTGIDYWTGLVLTAEEK